MKVINWILFVLALAGIALCAFTAYQFAAFPAADYTMKIEALDAETSRIEANTKDLEAQLEARESAIRADLAQAGADGAAAAERVEKAQEEHLARQEQLAYLQDRIAFTENIKENTMALREEYAAKIRQLEDLIVSGQSDVKICYWTFDDGPGQMTSSILDLCAEKGIYVTFFTSREANETGTNDANEPDLLRREAMGGHSIGNHSNSHQYSMIAGNLYTRGIDSFKDQVRLQDEWILENTGIKADLFRFPGGSAHAFTRMPRADYEAVLEELGYVWIDWSCDVMDNLISNPDPATVYARASWQVRQMNPPIAVVLSHDWNVATFYGFKSAVDELTKAGYVFLPLFSQSWTMKNTTVMFS